jgi:hypothetical protein
MAVVVAVLLLLVLRQQVQAVGTVEQEQHPLFLVRPSHTLVVAVAEWIQIHLNLQRK